MTLLWGIPVVLSLGLLLFFRMNIGRRLAHRSLPKPNLSDPNNWTIGPVVNGENVSDNMSVHPGPGFVIDMPTPTSQPHYVTVDYGPLTGKSKLTIHVRLDGGPFYAKDGTSQASLCLYFQRRYDDWRATESNPPQLSDTESFRWYATGSALLPLTVGDFTVTANLTDKWTATAYSDSFMKAEAFKMAVDDAGEVGFVLGGGDGWGHGIMSPNPSKITVTGFVIE